VLRFEFGRLWAVDWSLRPADHETDQPREAEERLVQIMRSALQQRLGRKLPANFGWGDVVCVYDDRGGRAVSRIEYKRYPVGDK